VIPELLETLVADPFAVMNTIGLVAFALVGATKAIRERFDLFGITVVGLATAFAGGVTRDLLVTRVPLALRTGDEIALGLLGVTLAIVITAVLESPDDHPITQVSDAVGLAAFATTGAIVATEAGLSGFGVVTVATINAAGGGAVADILLDRSPFILFDDFYASCAVLGGTSYWLLSAIGGGVAPFAPAACAAVTVGTRLAAVTYGWSLPSVQLLGLTRE